MRVRVRSVLRVLRLVLWRTAMSCVLRPVPCWLRRGLLMALASFLVSWSPAPDGLGICHVFGLGFIVSTAFAPVSAPRSWVAVRMRTSFQFSTWMRVKRWEGAVRGEGVELK
jgi:hypothetical protein